MGKHSACIPATPRAWLNPVPGLLAELHAILGADGLLTRPEELFVYEADGLTHHSARPSAVTLPRDAGEVQRVVRACRKHGVPFVPRGAGTGLSGGAVACHGGVVIECARMNRVLRIDAVAPLPPFKFAFDLDQMLLR